MFFYKAKYTRKGNPTRYIATKDVKRAETINSKGYGLAKFAENATNSKKAALEFARNTYDKNTLNTFYKVGYLTNEQMKLTGTKSSEIKFSLDNMIKNRINHPDLNFYDYKKS